MKHLLIGLPMLLSATPAPETPASLETWRYNAGERTRSALGALGRGDLETASERFEAADRLAPGNPVAGYNAGTGRLIAGHEDAVERLERVAPLAPVDLQPDAWFNLGNAHLTSGDPAAAIAAYEEALRVEPSHLDAKFNLELALRRLEQQRQQQRQESSEGEAGDSARQPPETEQSPPDRQQPGDQTEDGDRPSAPEAAEQGGPDEESRPGDEPLPGFEPQPEMDAAQAAAILEAVEDLEREHRQRQAEERARRQSKTGKDW